MTFITTAVIGLRVALLTRTVVYGAIAIVPSSSQQTLELQKQVVGLENQIQVLGSKYTHLEKMFQEYIKIVSLSSKYSENMQMQLDVLTNLLSRQKTWLVDIKAFAKDTGTTDTARIAAEAIPSTVKKPSSSVVFSAYMDKDMDNMGADQPIVFNQVLINEGGAYNKHTGVFTCPIDGLYDFSFVIGQRDKNGVWAKLLVNSDVMVAAGVDTEHKWQDSQGANRVFTRLKKGAVVRIVTEKGGTHVEGDTQRFTTFSGLLVST